MSTTGRVRDFAFVLALDFGVDVALDLGEGFGRVAVLRVVVDFGFAFAIACSIGAPRKDTVVTRL